MTSPSKNVTALFGVMKQYGTCDAVVYGNEVFTYFQFQSLVEQWETRLSDEYHIRCGDIVGILAEFTPNSSALIFALLRLGGIIVPFSKVARAEIPALREIATVEKMFTFTDDKTWDFSVFEPMASNPLITSFRKRKTPGLIVFTSGSTGTKKGILHDCDKVIEKFLQPRPGWRTVLFLMIDHFGGFNTFLSAFAYGGCAVCLVDRRPETVCAAIASSRSTLLPTTPTFLNLIAASKVFGSHDLTSVELVTYGTEVMTEATLLKTKEMFPNAKLKQTYGLSEVGVLRSQSRSDDSTAIRVGGDGFEVKVIDGILWVKSSANMVGYLNAPNPIDEEGWLCTGDEVQTDGDYIRILGRKSEMINVGGQKVFPAEVESVLLNAPNVKEASVSGRKHALMGQVVIAQVALHAPEDQRLLSERLRKVCVGALSPFKVPVSFKIVESAGQVSDRFKKIRNTDEPLTEE